MGGGGGRGWYVNKSKYKKLNKHSKLKHIGSIIIYVKGWVFLFFNLLVLIFIPFSFIIYPIIYSFTMGGSKDVGTTNNRLSPGNSVCPRRPGRDREVLASTT